MTITFDKLYYGEHKPRFHGNGFTQLYLAENRRLHVWHPKMRPIRNHNATIHNHRYDVFSRVMHGTLRHKTYKIYEDEVLGEYQINRVTTSKAENGAPVKTPTRVGLIETGCYRLPVGTTYNLSHPYLHSSESADGGMVVTVFDKYNVQPRDVHPIVISPVNEEPDPAFDPEMQPHIQDLWDIIFEALRHCEDLVALFVE